MKISLLEITVILRVVNGAVGYKDDRGNQINVLPREKYFYFIDDTVITIKFFSINLRDLADINVKITFFIKVKFTLI